MVKVLNEEHILSIELSFIFAKLDNTVRIGLVQLNFFFFDKLSLFDFAEKISYKI